MSVKNVLVKYVARKVEQSSEVLSLLRFVGNLMLGNGPSIAPNFLHYQNNSHLRSHEGNSSSHQLEIPAHKDSIDDCFIDRFYYPFLRSDFEKSKREYGIN